MKIDCSEMNIRNVFVIGMDVVSLAASASNAGYKIFAADYFGDQDLKKFCSECRSIIKQRPGRTCGQLIGGFNPEALLQLVKELLKNNQIDVTLLSSGLDDSFDVLVELDEMIPILGNRPDVIKKVRDKLKFFKDLKRLGIPHPETAIVEDFEEAKEKARDIGYPVIVKPFGGFGGEGIRKAGDPQELRLAFQKASMRAREVLVQEYISGMPASTSLIASENGTIILTLNEQLLGQNQFGQEEPFGYSGNVVPLFTTKAVADRCETIVDRIAAHFGLVGSNGVDLVISRDGVPFVIEVNPRFQATLECVEQVLGLNIVRTHMKACFEGNLPKFVKEPLVFCARLILLAQKRLIAPALGNFDQVRDVPMPGAIIEKGEPICSIIIEEDTRDCALEKAGILAKLIRERF